MKRNDILIAAIKKVTASTPDRVNRLNRLLSDADLRQADLSNDNLRGANLRCANLYNDNLRGANLRCANLYSADLRGANLRCANLYSADLRGANLRCANLYNDNLRCANLYNDNLCCADLSNANLSNCILISARGVIYSSCTWSDHGENGRQLLSVYHEKTEITVYYCGCFIGLQEDLLDYINNGEEDLKESRLIALEFNKARMAEMLEKRN